MGSRADLRGSVNWGMEVGVEDDRGGGTTERSKVRVAAKREVCTKGDWYLEDVPLGIFGDV